jgi:probable HAF family extracellular repeat protein
MRQFRYLPQSHQRASRRSDRLSHAWRSAAGAALLAVLAGCAGAAGDRQVRSEVAADSSSGAKQDLSAESAESVELRSHQVLANAINDAGAIAGQIRIGGAQGCALVWDSGAAPARVLASGDGSSATDINNSGTVAGYIMPSGTSARGSRESASRWSGGNVQKVTLAGAHSSSGSGINSRDEVIGTYERADGNPRGFLWNGSRSLDLGDSPHPEFARVFPTDINDQGTVVGYLLPVQGESFQATRIHGSDAFIWRNGVMRQLVTDSSLMEIEAWGINNAGDVVGYMTPRSTERKVAYLFSGGELTQLALPAGWRQSEAVAINDLGQIVGSAVDSLSRVHAVLWEGGRMRNLGTLPGDSANDIDTRATAINAAGRIVGYSESSRGRMRAFYWENGSMKELLPPTSGEPRCLTAASSAGR